MGLKRPLRRIGVFGGAFDPPHCAHLALARQALTQLGLERLHVVPTGMAHHRRLAPTCAEHRLAMTRLAFANVEGVVVDPREVQRSGPSYTIDTLIELQSQYPGTQLVLIIGGDQAAAFEQWHRKDEILQIAIISVADRANAVPVGLAPELQHLPGGRLERLQLPLMPVSATDIRQRVSTHMGITDLVPAQVARYIDQHHLYQSA